MDPRFRLQRRYPGERFSEPSALGVRLRERDKPLREERQVLGSSVSVGEPKVRANRARVHPGPNAPLLKRLVLFPYRQDTTFPRRHEVRSPIPWDLLARENLETVPMMVAARPQPVMGSPVRALMNRVVAREPVESIETWLEGR